VLIRIDAQLSPTLAPWLASVFDVEAVAVRDVGLRDAEDPAIFAAARLARAVLLTKDSDFVALVERLGPPPQVIWLTCGNTSNEFVRTLLSAAWPRIAALLLAGEPLVELSTGIGPTGGPG
jgi:predicted nuclease of predicted toxin-antitoxin system